MALLSLLLWGFVQRWPAAFPSHPLTLPGLRACAPRASRRPGPSVGSSAASSWPRLMDTDTLSPCPRLCTPRVPTWGTHSSLFYGLFCVPAGRPSYPPHPGAPTPLVGAFHMPRSLATKWSHPRLWLLEARVAPPSYLLCTPTLGTGHGNSSEVHRDM